MGTVARAAVLGSPVTHSLSPVLHRAAYAELGLDWSYEAIECGEDELPGFVSGLDDSWAGLSLTMPLKRVALDVADSVTPLARDVGAANTLVLGDGRTADNTDVPGLRVALTEAGLNRPRRPVLLGGGATACSAAAALAGLGATGVVAVVRSEARAAELRTVAERFGMTCRFAGWPGDDELSAADLVVSTVPGGTTDALVPYADRVVALFDVAYAPWPTALAAAVESSGGTVVGGFELLLHQAALQVVAMTGREAPVAAMRRAGETELARRAGTAS
ncbi:MAG: shikimate dehydrogenase [Streptosporangiales bacterium]|nr:shikimate dehydrogenase [Streptosporangiales bacterium]